MAGMQLSEIRVDDPLMNREEADCVSSQPDQERKIPKIPKSLWLSSIMKEAVKEYKNNQSSSGPQIPKVPIQLKDENKECYEPLVVSIGPYHYKDREDKFSDMEKLKVQMARQFVTDSGKEIEFLYSEVEKEAGNARRFYDEGSIEGIDDEQLTRMMFLDGCFILQFIHCFTLKNLEMSDQQASLVKRDLLLMENQLPFPVLKTLMSLRYEKDGKDHGNKIIYDFLYFQILQLSNQPYPKWILTWLARGFLLLLLLYTLVFYPFYILPEQDFSPLFLPFFGIFLGGVIYICKMVVSLLRLLLRRKKRPAAKYDWHQEPAHILELLYSMVVNSHKAKHKHSLVSCRCLCCCCCYCFSVCLGKLFCVKPKLRRSRGHNLYYSAKDLRRVGIHFMPSKTNTLMDVEFKSSIFYGTLKLPSITIDTSTRSKFLNLVAYETSTALNHDDQLWVTSYICFMDSLIDDAEDVKLLRSKDILISHLGPDQKVADLFNQIGSSLKPVTNAYNDVKREINIQCESVLKKWIAEWQEAYFSSPWAFIAFVAAAVGLTLTALQTFYSYRQVYPSKDKSPPPSSSTCSLETHYHQLVFLWPLLHSLLQLLAWF